MEQVPDALHSGAPATRRKSSEYVYQMATLAAVLLLLLTSVI